MIALSLNASAMYLGFAFGGALGRAVLGALSPIDLGRSVAQACLRRFWCI
jgi:hypothetical protein